MIFKQSFYLKGKDEVFLFSDIAIQNIDILKSKLKSMLTESVSAIDSDLTADLAYGYSIYPTNGGNADELMQSAYKDLLKKDKDQIL